jgi:hypothetical protein
MVHYYTSITSNYLPKARVLAASIRRHDPDAVIHLVLCDVPPPKLDLGAEPFDHLHSIGDLGIPDLERWLFKHDVVELCTAAKGPALWKILGEHRADQVFFFDPDIVLLDDPAELHARLAQTNVVLTPHLVAPEQTEEGVVDNEISGLRHGAYNLGFLGVRRTPAGTEFARWWRDRLLAHCYADIPAGLFTDQRWCDLAPGLFEGVTVLRDKRYNVATWNLSHRQVSKGGDGKLEVDGRPVLFFHFSGFDSGAQMENLRKYAPLRSPLFELHHWYVAEMDRHGQRELGGLEHAYARYRDGTPIPARHRRAYRRRPDLQARFPDPFSGELARWLEAESPAEAAARETDGDLKQTLTWRLGRLVTAPIERAMGRVPGLVPAVKRLFRRR